MLQRIAPLTFFIDRIAMAITAPMVTRRGMMLSQVAEPSRLKLEMPTSVASSLTMMPASCKPRNAMNRPMPAGIAVLTAAGMASKISLRRPVTVSRMKIRPSTRTKTKAFAYVKPKPKQTV